MESAKKEATEISTLFDTLITALDTHLDALNAQFDKERDAMLASLTPASSIETPEEEWDGERREKERELARQREKEVDAKVGTKRRKEVASMKEAITLAWVTYMRVSRRTQVKVYSQYCLHKRILKSRTEYQSCPTRFQPRS